MKRLNHLDFIDGNITLSFNTTVDDKGVSSYHFEVKKGTEYRNYFVKQYVNLLMELYYIEADKSIFIFKKIKLLNHAESEIHRLSLEHGLKEKGFDLSEFIEDIKIQRNRLNEIKSNRDKYVFLILGGLISFISTITINILNKSMQDKDQSHPQQSEITLRVIQKDSCLKTQVHFEQVDSSVKKKGF